MPETAAGGRRKSDEILQAMLKGTPDLVYAKDLEGRYLLINERAARMYGRSAEEIVGVDDSAIFPDEVVQVIRENDHHVIATGKNATVQETFTDAAGVERIFLATRGPLFDHGGAVTGLFSISREITEQVRAQEALLVNQEQLRELAIELSLAEEKERRRIASELHDEIGQNLSLAKLKLSGLGSDEKLPGGATRTVREVAGLLERAIREVRTLTFQISPPLLYEVGFEAAVEWLAEQFETNYRLRVSLESAPAPSTLEEELSSTLYHAVRELLVNVVKHAGARQVRIAIRRREGRLEVTVQDDGKGISPCAPPASGGFGLFNIRQRVQHLGGEVTVTSGAGGTSVTIAVPAGSADAAEGEE
ncbi:PAS domain-containing sensor histidine kinase [Geomonas edaphica]|uniref:PAS domain-containing sensor histidine kinase n=1 Tax=Geomonas edaphica TaxID=2570226 RepID=UPI0010A7B559|nr:PAS domain-containing protein [Geomonas edaphica]